MFSSECFIADILKRMKDDATLDPETMQYYWNTKLPNAYRHFFLSVVATIALFQDAHASMESVLHSSFTCFPDKLSWSMLLWQKLSGWYEN